MKSVRDAVHRHAEGRRHVKAEAEMRAMQLQARELQGLLSAAGS